MEDIIIIVKSIEDSGLLLKGVTETVQNDIKKQKGGFLSMLQEILGNTLAGKGINKKGKGIIRAGMERQRQQDRVK